MYNKNKKVTALSLKTEAEFMFTIPGSKFRFQNCKIRAQNFSEEYHWQLHASSEQQPDD